jgi:hypothetical protein
MQPNAVEIDAGRGRIERRKTRLRTLAHLDGRTRASKRARELVAAFKAALSDAVLSPSQCLAVEHAAMLSALAEDAASRRLAGASDVTLEDTVRLARVAQTALKALNLDRRREKPRGLLGHLADADRAAQRKAAPPPVTEGEDEELVDGEVDGQPATAATSNVIGADPAVAAAVAHCEDEV